MIEKDISNQDLMRDAKISANIITKNTPWTIYGFR